MKTYFRSFRKLRRANTHIRINLNSFSLRATSPR
jgi:hypothetical protein